MSTNKGMFTLGLAEGLAIGLGYLSVSFSFGILAVSSGLSWWQATLMSLLNVTSAGQVAAVGIMSASGGLIEMAITTAVINIRYALMSISLSQKTDESMTTPYRLLLANFITDEIFGVASSAPFEVNRRFMAGLAVLPVAGWTLGTLLGAIFGAIMPDIVSSSMAIGIYGMFIAIVLPVTKKDKIVMWSCLVAITLSIMLYFVPFLKDNVDSGFAIIISSVIAALVGVFMLPEEDETNENEVIANE